MDLATAVVTLVAGGVAVLPRVPALTSAGRAQAAIQRDTELWAALAPGHVRDRLGAEIQKRTTALLDERGRDKVIERAWLAATALLALTWVLLVVSDAITGQQSWAQDVRNLLMGVSLATAFVGLLLLVAVPGMIAWKAVKRVYSRVKSHRHRQDAITYEI